MGIFSFIALLFLLHNGAHSSNSMDYHHFVLVHGSGHGAWCWYKVSELLQDAGHVVHALDLQSAGINNVEPATILSLEQYSRPLMQLLDTINESVVLVGHSLGGSSITLGMERHASKVKAAVFVTALMYRDGPNDILLSQQNFNSSSIQDNIDYQYLNGVPVSASFKLSSVSHVLYNLSPNEDVVLAKSLLKQSPLVNIITNVTDGNYGSILRFFVMTSHDNIIHPESQARIIQNNPPTKVFKIASDHSPFFSKPHQLVSVLLNVGELLN